MESFLEKALRARIAADIVFCFDCTGSMIDVLPAIKEKVENLISGLKEKHGIPNWRARCIGYRNFELEEEYLINDFPFVSTEEELKAQIDGMKTMGSSEEEDSASTFDAIWYAAKKSEWHDNCHKAIVVFTDAAAKPVNEKTLAEVSGSDSDMRVMAEALVTQHIRLFFWGKSDPKYNALVYIPRADVVQFDNPKEEFKTIDFTRLLERLSMIILPKYY